MFIRIRKIRPYSVGSKLDLATIDRFLRLVLHPEEEESTLGSVASEIASRVNKMKKELQTKQQEIKQLQQEFA